MIQCPKCKRYFGAGFLPIHGPVGRRCTGGSKVLTPDDVAKKLETAAMRVWRIMMDARQTEGLFENVKATSMSGVLQGLRAELDAWEVKPLKRGYEDDQAQTT